MSSYITFNGIGEEELGLTVKNIERPVLPSVDNRFVKINNSDGSYYFGANLSNREISITFQITSATNKSQLHAIISNVAGWLFPDDRQPKDLIINDESNKKYIAQIDGETNFNELFLYGEFTVNFVCSDPYKYALTQTTIANTNLSPLFTTSQIPIITVTFTGSETDFEVEEQESGDIVAITGSFVNTDIVVIDCINKTITKNGSSIITQLDFINTTWIKLLSSGYDLAIDTVNASFVTKITERFL